MTSRSRPPFFLRPLVSLFACAALFGPAVQARAEVSGYHRFNVDWVNNAGDTSGWVDFEGELADQDEWHIHFDITDTNNKDGLGARRSHVACTAIDGPEYYLITNPDVYDLDVSDTSSIDPWRFTVYTEAWEDDYGSCDSSYVGSAPWWADVDEWCSSGSVNGDNTTGTEGAWQENQVGGACWVRWRRKWDDFRTPDITTFTDDGNKAYDLTYNTQADLSDVMGLGATKNVHYKYDACPTTGDVSVAMSFVSGNNYRGTIPAPGAGNWNKTLYWIVRACDTQGNCLTSSCQTGGRITDPYAPTVTLSNVAGSWVQSDVINFACSDSGSGCQSTFWWDYDADGVCSTNSAIYANSTTLTSVTINTTHNDYICLLVKDNEPNVSTTSARLWVDATNTVLNASSFSGCNYVNGSICWVKNGTNFTVRLRYYDQHSEPSGNQFLSFTSGCTPNNCGCAWYELCATGNEIKSYIDTDPVGGYADSHWNDSYLNITGASCTEAGGCTGNYAQMDFTVTGGSSEKNYDIYGFQYDLVGNGPAAGYNDTGLDLRLDNTAPTFGAVTPANTATALYVDGTFDLSTTFADGTGSGVASCQYCKSTDGVCDTEWAAATWSAGTCSVTGLTCTNGQALTLNMRATDNVGIVGQASGASRTCDTTTPTFGTVTPANTATATYVDGTFDLSTTFSDTGSNVASCQYCKSTDGVCDTEWAAATWSAGTCSFTGTTCTNGQTVTLNMRAYDGVNNLGTATAVSRTCDTTTPTFGTVTPANTATASHVDGTFDLSTTFSDTGSNVASCQYCKSTDGTCDTEWVNATWSAGTCSFTGATCTNGQALTLNMRAYDAVNNLGTATAVSRTCDTAVPTFGTVTPANTATATHVDGTFDLSTTFADGTGAGVASCQYCKSTDGTCDTEWAAATWSAGTCSFTGTTCTNGQTVTLNMRAADSVGNQWGTATQVSRTCDTAVPTFGTVTPANTATATHVDGTFDLSTTFADGTGAGVASCQYCKSTDGTCDTEWAAATWSAGTCSFTGATCTNGQALTLNMRAADSVGNQWGTATQVSRTCDTAAPPVPTISSVTNTGNLKLTVNWSTVVDAGSGLANYELDRIGAGQIATPASGATSYQDTVASDNTEYCYQMRSKDNVGNLSANSTQKCATAIIANETIAAEVKGFPASATDQGGTYIGTYVGAGTTVYLLSANGTVADSEALPGASGS
ncbi:MAG: hypothetical protein HYT87_11840, partial [Nitrospirae bacterium]|nr:hypothetical protein [Nitrospirota bacterium]